MQASGWLSDLLDQLEGASGFEMLESPDGLQGTLRPYQSRGFSWLAFLRRWGFGACLADDMGLGKTIQTLALVQREWESRPGDERKPTLLDLPDVGRRQLAERGGEVHARLAGDGSPRSGPCAWGRLQEAGRQACSGPVELLALAPRARPAEAGAVGVAGARRGAEHQEPADQAGAGGAVDSGRSSNCA